MHVHAMLMLMAGAVAIGWPAVPAGAQTAPAPGAARPTPVRAVLASAALPTVVDTPLHYKLLRVTLPAGRSASHAGAEGFIFQMSGMLDVTVEGTSSTLRGGDALFIAAGKRATLRATGGEQAVFLHFLLGAAPELNRAAEAEPAAIAELYWSAAAIRYLKPGPYEFTLTRVTSPPRMPPNPAHHRSGAALYYVLSGTGTFVPEGKAEARPAGSVVYEPHDLVHQWGNAGETPLVLLQANISPEGVPVVIMGSPSDIKR